MLQTMQQPLASEPCMLPKRAHGPSLTTETAQQRAQGLASHQILNDKLHDIEDFVILATLCWASCARRFRVQVTTPTIQGPTWQKSNHATMQIHRSWTWHKCRQWSLVNPNIVDQRIPPTERRLCSKWTSPDVEASHMVISRMPQQSEQKYRTHPKTKFPWDEENSILCNACYIKQYKM